MLAGVALPSVIDLYTVPLMSVRRFDADANVRVESVQAARQRDAPLDPLIGDTSSIPSLVVVVVGSRFRSIDPVKGSIRRGSRSDDVGF